MFKLQAVKRNLRYILFIVFIAIGLLILVQNVFRIREAFFSTKIQQSAKVDLLIVKEEVKKEPPSSTKAPTRTTPTTPSTPLLTELDPDEYQFDEDDSQQNEHLELANRRGDVPLPTVVPTKSHRLQMILKCKNRALVMDKLQYGSYWLLRNFIVGSISRGIGCADSITYTTIGDYTFFDSLAMVVSRWLAPVSFAIFAPGYDLNATMDSIQHVRQCLPESELIRKFVTFHIYFPAEHMPAKIPLCEAEATNWNYDCNAPKAPYEDVDRKRMYKTLHNLTYPINVGRNIARYSANTHFIFACDIELFPSVGLVKQFLDMVERNPEEMVGGDKLRVFVLPVFEMEKNFPIPQYKSELEQLLRSNKAIPFHSYTCRYCHLVPQQEFWVNATADRLTELSVFTVGKREGKHRYWEPFYISDNREPMFDERVTWEGQSNKRIQGYAMCLLGYEYHILHPAFLIHSPGIKRFNSKSPRMKYVPPMNRLIRLKIIPEYKVLYGRNNHCVN